MSKKNFTEEDAKKALKQILEEYGVEMARNIERVYRWETAHFTSRQYILTGSPGMEAAPGAKAPYYGWSSTPWIKQPQHAPCRTISMFENKGMSGTPGANAQVTNAPKQFLQFNTVYSAMYALAEYILRYGGNYARWYSTTEQGQQIYRDKLALVRPRIVESLG